jgi:hypothetical protein
MRIVEEKITYELSPEEREAGIILESEIRLKTYNGKFEVERQTPKGKMQFDANYNSYYAQVTYRRIFHR